MKTLLNTFYMSQHQYCIITLKYRLRGYINFNLTVVLNSHDIYTMFLSNIYFPHSPSYHFLSCTKAAYDRHSSIVDHTGTFTHLYSLYLKLWKPTSRKQKPSGCSVFIIDTSTCNPL